MVEKPRGGPLTHSILHHMMRWLLQFELPKRTSASVVLPIRAVMFTELLHACIAADVKALDLMKYKEPTEEGPLPVAIRYKAYKLFSYGFVVILILWKYANMHLISINSQHWPIS